MTPSSAGAPLAAAALLDRLTGPNLAHAARFPSPPPAAQPLHTVYGGAHLFRAETPARLGELALRAVATHAPEPMDLAAALGLDPALAEVVYSHVAERLRERPVEDFRLDFEDGFGERDDDEEDAVAVRAAEEVGRAASAGTLPETWGIRPKSWSEATKRRALRTLERFLGAVVDRAGGLPPGFVVTFPKVLHVDQVRVGVDVLHALERRFGLPERSVPVELMLESTQAVFAADGTFDLPRWPAAAAGRCRGVHLGVYDYTASAEIVGLHQVPTHPSAELARQLLKLAFAGTGVALVDGPCTRIPVGGRDAVHAAWREGFAHVQRSLHQGFYQGWDLHPAQLPVRFAATFAFYRAQAAPVGERLRAFLERAAQASLVGTAFDDAATGQGLLAFFARAWASGAVSAAELDALRLSPASLRGTFSDVVAHRRA